MLGRLHRETSYRSGPPDTSVLGRREPYAVALDERQTGFDAEMEVQRRDVLCLGRGRSVKDPWTLTKLETAGDCLNIIKAVYENPTANIILNCEPKTKQQQQQQKPTYNERNKMHVFWKGRSKNDLC